MAWEAGQDLTETGCEQRVRDHFRTKAENDPQRHILDSLLRFSLELPSLSYLLRYEIGRPCNPVEGLEFLTSTYHGPNMLVEKLGSAYDPVEGSDKLTDAYRTADALVRKLGGAALPRPVYPDGAPTFDSYQNHWIRLEEYIADIIARATPTDDEPESTGAREGEGGKPENNQQADTFIPLTSWDDILAALNEPHGKAFWKKNVSTRDKIRKLNEQRNGPIVFPPGKGNQPHVDKTALMSWWNETQTQFDARNREAESAAEAARVETADSHKYGATGTVVPSIGGSVKAKRTTGKKGKEGKR